MTGGDPHRSLSLRRVLLYLAAVSFGIWWGQADLLRARCYQFARLHRFAHDVARSAAPSPARDEFLLTYAEAQDSWPPPADPIDPGAEPSMLDVWIGLGLGVGFWLIVAGIGRARRMSTRQLAGAVARWGGLFHLGLAVSWCFDVGWHGWGHALPALGRLFAVWALLLVAGFAAYGITSWLSPAEGEEAPAS